MTDPFARHPIGWTATAALWLIPAAVFLWRSRKARTQKDRIWLMISAAIPTSMALAIVC